MKNKIIALTLSVSLLFPTLAFGENSNGNTNKNKTSKENQNIMAKEKKTETNKYKSEEFKAQIRSKHTLMKDNTRKIKELKKQIQTKKQELKKIISEINNGTKTLSPDKIAVINEKSKEIKNISNKIKSETTLKKDAAATKDNYKNKNYEVALQNLDNIITKQAARISLLNELNLKMDEMLEIANTATK